MKRWMIIAMVAGGITLVAGMGLAGYYTSRPQPTQTVIEPPTVTVGRCDVQQTISAPGSVVGTREETIQMPADGALAEILVRAGQPVKQGEVLARLGNPQKYAAAEADARLALLDAQRNLSEVKIQAPLKTAEAQAALLAAEKELNKAKSSRLSKNYQRASQETIDIARANLMLAKAEMDAAQKNYELHRGRADDDPQKANALSRAAAARQEYNRHKSNLDFLLTGPTELEIQQADAAIAVAQANYDALLQAWELVKDGPDALALEQAQAQIDQAQAELDLASEVVQSVEIRAPFDGVVTEVTARVGLQTPAGTSLMTLIDPQAVEVEASVVEEDLPLLETGMPASLFFDALPDADLSGYLVSIIPRRIAGDRPLYKISIALDEVPDGLVDGMTADTAITIANRPDVLCLPRTVVRATGVTKTIVKVWDGLQTVSREIEIGLRGDTSIEIISGLQEGERVVTK